MSYISFKHRGDFKRTKSFLNKASKRDFLNDLHAYGRMGVEALSEATPVDSGTTSHSWSYTIERNKDDITISWLNNNVNNGVNIAIILQYGHGTGTGGYVQGRDYINPAIRPVFDKIAEDAWKGVVLS